MTGQDRVAHRGLVAVGEVDLDPGDHPAEPVCACSPVEEGDQVAGWGEDEGVMSSGACAVPRIEYLGDGAVLVGGVNTIVV